MSLRITLVLDDHDRDDLHIVINQERGTAQVIETSRQGIVTADELVVTVDSITRLLTELGTILATILAMANITPDE